MGGVAWTKEEDHLLKTCIEQNGEGKWHRIPMLAGLNRCRKSCRLRWLNYLRPNIKRGNFAEDEIELIIKLQKLLGNRWSFIAGKLPGRTANDVKNYWKCHLSKRLGAHQDQAADTESPSSTKVKVFRPQPQNLVGTSKRPTTPQEASNIIAPPADHQTLYANPSTEEVSSTSTTMVSSSPVKLLASGDAGGDHDGHFVPPGYKYAFTPTGDDRENNNDNLEMGENDLVGDFSLDFGLEDMKVGCCVDESTGGCSKWDSDDLILGMDLWSESL